MKANELQLLAGRGALGDINWGANFDNDRSKLKPQLERLKKYIGQKVYVSGGGGFPGFAKAVLLGAKIVKFGPKAVALQAHLKTADKRLADDNGVFHPFINSWQISVPKGST